MGDVPICEIYRDVPIHADQPRSRIEAKVKPAIDRVYAIGNDLEALVKYADDWTNPPEARLYAAAMAEAIFQLAVEERRERPVIDLQLLRASVTGLDSMEWRDPLDYCSLLEMWRDAPGSVKPDRRETPLDFKRPV